LSKGEVLLLNTASEPGKSEELEVDDQKHPFG
jgi:hypothetical protein